MSPWIEKDSPCSLWPTWPRCPRRRTCSPRSCRPPSSRPSRHAQHRRRLGLCGTRVEEGIPRLLPPTWPCCSMCSIRSLRCCSLPTSRPSNAPCGAWNGDFAVSSVTSAQSVACSDMARLNVFAGLQEWREHHVRHHRKPGAQSSLPDCIVSSYPGHL